MDNNNLDVVFDYVKRHITYNHLWKIGVYYSQVRELGDELHNNSHGIEIESIFRHLLKAKNITDIVIIYLNNKSLRSPKSSIIPALLVTTIYRLLFW